MVDHYQTAHTATLEKCTKFDTDPSQQRKFIK